MTTDKVSSSFRPPPLSNETIQERLDTGAVGATGSRASLQKCATRYRSFLEAIHAESPNADHIEVSKQELEQELQLYQLQVHKMALILHRARSELEDLTNAQQGMQEVACAQETLAKLRQEHETRIQTRQEKQEFEALAKMANHRPSRIQLKKRLQKSQEELKDVQARMETTQQELQVRSNQYRLLVQCLMDLTASVESDEKSNPDEDEDDDDDEGLVPMDTAL